MSTPSLIRYSAIAILAMAACGSPPPDGPTVEGDPVGVVGAHEHGVARLSLAVDASDIHIRLEAPGDVLFGFERAPRTDDERTLVAERVGRLESGLASAVVVPADLGCRATGPVQLEGVPDHAGADEHADAGEHEGEDHAHDEHTDDEHTHDEHSHDEDGEHDDAQHEDHAGEHLEVTAEVTLTCERSPEGTEGTLAILDLLPELELVDLTVLTSEGDAAARVAGDAAFSF